ncbi:hypothetical protein BASA61_008123 [Batrachochytrium salamandrivorans]|nr:hypothetical protein BASA61_008123 [Batrachochytrium salamandrivorans]
MIALVQILIAAVLIPVSFGAPAVDASEPAPTIRPLAFVPARKTYLVSRDGKCGEGTDSMCEAGVCCSKNGVCGTTKDHCKAGCQSEFGSCDPTGPVKHLEHTRDNNSCGIDCQEAFGFCNPRPYVEPRKVSSDGKCGKGTEFGCEPGNCALSMALVELRVITVVLAVNLDLVYVIPPCLFHNRLAENS